MKDCYVLYLTGFYLTVGFALIFYRFNSVLYSCTEHWGYCIYWFLFKFFINDGDIFVDAGDIFLEEP